MTNEIEKIIKEGENAKIEFKEVTNELPKNLFETVCAFLNTNGGYIILGVKDNKEITGINPLSKEKLIKEFTTSCNNKEIINPTIKIELNEKAIDNKILLYAYIEPTNEVHTTKGKIFIRNYEGDFNITNNIPLIVKVYNRKHKIYDEDEIFTDINIKKDLRNDIFENARTRADLYCVGKTHPWVNMSNLEILKSLKMYKKDKETGKYGVTLAGIMIFGTDEIIGNINPFCRTDALLRIDDLDRYDDRDIVETNLYDMFFRITSFIDKYTMNRFGLDENLMSISPGAIMFKEMVVNSLMHRDYRDGHISRIIVYKDKVTCENPNNFYTNTKLTPKNNVANPKNPNIAKFFKEIGLSDELGSGIRKITKNSLKYSGKIPTFEDNEIFKVTIPLLRDRYVDELEPYDEDKLFDEPVSEPVNEPLNKLEKDIIELVNNKKNLTREEISKELNISLATVKRYISKLKNKKLIKRVGSDKTGYWKVIK